MFFQSLCLQSLISLSFVTVFLTLHTFDLSNLLLIKMP